MIWIRKLIQRASAKKKKSLKSETIQTTTTTTGTKTAKAKKESETVERNKTMINTTATLMMNQKITSTMSSNSILLPTLSDMWLVLDTYIVRDVGDII